MKKTFSPQAPTVSRRPNRKMTARSYSWGWDISASLFLCHRPHLHGFDHAEEGEGEGGHNQHQGENGDEEGADARTPLVGWNRALHYLANGGPYKYSDQL